MCHGDYESRITIQHDEEVIEFAFPKASKKGDVEPSGSTDIDKYEGYSILKKIQLHYNDYLESF